MEHMRPASNCFPVSPPTPGEPLEPPQTSTVGTQEGQGRPSSPVPFRESVTRDELEKALTQIKKRLYELDKTPISDQDGTVDLLAEKGSSMLEAISKNSEDLATEISTAGANSEAVVRVMVNLLEGLGSLHWAAAGLSVIAVAFKTYQDASENQKVCRDVLRRMVDVLELLKELWEPNQKHEAMLRRITGVIILSAMKCLSITNKAWLSRIFFASTTKGDLADFRTTLDEACQDLHLIITKELVDRAPKPYFQPEPKRQSAIGLESKTDHVMSLLQFGVHDKRVRAVCLHGMGGIGKSTLGDAVHTKLQVWENHCKVQLLVGQTADDLRKRQKEIMEKLLKCSCEEIGNEDDGLESIKSNFVELKRPVFIFLDNVQSKEQVRKLVPEGDCFPVGSAILVTTRDKEVHNAFSEKNIYSELFEMKGLPENDARELLYTRIGKEKIQEASFEEVRASGCEARLLRACGGLPLALKVVGGYIGAAGASPNSKRVWEEVIQKLGEGKRPKQGDDEIHSSLMFSIEGLDEEEKSAFLDIVAFYSTGDFTWESVECYVGRELVALLEERALVERSHDIGERGLMMKGRVHDVLKGLGHRLIEKDVDQLRITRESDLLDVLEESNNQHPPSNLSKIRGIHLLGESEHHYLPATKLEQMRNLRVLSLDENWEIDGTCKQTPKKLQYIRLFKRWPFEGRVSANAIYLSGCDINSINLEFVKHLQIDGSSSLTSLAQIPNSVEGLVLGNCSSLTNNAIVEGIQRFSSLTYLRIAYCPLLRALPDVSSLEELYLRSCHDLHSLPPSLPRLRHLLIKDCASFREFPSDINTLTSLQSVVLSECESLEELPDAWGQVKLTLEECPILRTVPTDFIIQASSESMSFSFAEFPWIQELPKSLARLSFLQKLSLWGCKELSYIPPELGTTLCSLEDLTLEECENLETLPEELGLLKSLQFLNLSRCSNLKRLPQSFLKLGSLNVLYIGECASLETLPEDLGELHSLSVLGLSGTPIKQLPSSLGDLQCLSSLDLSECVNLEGLATGFTQLSSLQILLLRGCASMTCVPEGLLQMKSLRYVDIRRCSLQHLEDWKIQTTLKQSGGPFVVSSPLPDQLEYNGTKSGTVEERLVQCALYDARGERTQLRDNSMVGLVFQELDRGNRWPKGSFDFRTCFNAHQKLWRAGKRPQFIYVPYVSWSPDWRWDDYKRMFELSLEDVPVDLPEEWLRAIYPFHGTALYAALQEGAYRSTLLGGAVYLVLISLDKGPAHSWFDLLSLLKDAAIDQNRIAQMKLMKANVSLNSLLVTDKTDYVVSNDGKQVKVSALKGKIVGVYFCSFPPDEAFTQMLKAIYHKLKGTEQQAFEVVWIPSHDCPGDEICECCGDMPWPSLPACNGRSLQTLLHLSDRDPSPALVVFDGEGILLQANAVESCCIFGNRAYPFTHERIAGLLQSQPTLWTLLDGFGFDLIVRDGSKVDVNSLKAKTVGLLYLPYSSSNEKCDSLFVKKLIAKYEEIRVSPEQQLEIVTILYGGDSEEGFAAQDMPWLALPMGDALRLSWKAMELLKVWRGKSAAGDIDQNLLRWRWLLCYPLLWGSECLIMFNGEGSVMTGCGEDLLTSDGCELLPANRSLCISKVYGLPSTICHPSHPQHPISINAARTPSCDWCRTMCDLGVSYACVECDYDLCLDPCSKC